MGNLGDTLAKKLKQLGIERQVEAAGVVEAAQNEIEKYLDKEDFEIISFVNNVLKVVTSSSSAASELNLNSYQICASLRPNAVVNKILAIQIDKWKS